METGGKSVTCPGEWYQEGVWFRINWFICTVTRYGATTTVAQLADCSPCKVEPRPGLANIWNRSDFFFTKHSAIRNESQWAFGWDLKTRCPVPRYRRGTLKNPRCTLSWAHGKGQHFCYYCYLLLVTSWYKWTSRSRIGWSFQVPKIIDNLNMDNLVVDLRYGFLYTKS